ncbi:MAG: hypothetical protein WCS43_14370 [Verrucomicrobiota bacterium]
MADSSDSKKTQSGGGCFRKLIVLIILLASIGIGVGCFFIAQKQDLSDIGGYGPVAKATPVRDLRVVLRNSIDRGYPVTLTETEINQWLGRTLRTKQGGLLAGQVSLERLWVRLDDEFAEVIMERKFMGKPFTVSMFLKIEQIQGPREAVTEVHLEGGPYDERLPFPTRGGRFGRLVVPQGFLLLVLPAFKKLPDLFHEEIDLAFKDMARIKIEKNQLVLDPKEPSDGQSGLPQSF